MSAGAISASQFLTSSHLTHFILTHGMQVPLECTLEELYRGCEKVVEASADVPEALLVKVCALLKAVFPSFGHENN